MKISAAQIEPVKGDIPENINKHVEIITKALAFKPDAIFFPELSLTGYEPTLAKQLATTIDDQRIDIFQKISDSHKITIGIGLPIISTNGILISMVIFQPDIPRKTYAKQQLHEDEKPYFVSGNHQIQISINNQKVAPAICYESLQPNHSEKAHQLGAEIYLTSVAKSQMGVDNAKVHFSEIARKYAMPVLMTNCIGFCDNFESAGNSSVWNKKGKLIGELDRNSEGILIFDTETEKIIIIV
ncbi:MAG: carbon-nitrogen hydrolase family protein [Flammeovirgaceae bacterium]|nr:carbon-nitrogen hydrolase family protein [Flammeovirgaceae bacterium]